MGITRRKNKLPTWEGSGEHSTASNRVKIKLKIIQRTRCHMLNKNFIAQNFTNKSPYITFKSISDVVLTNEKHTLIKKILILKCQK